METRLSLSADSVTPTNLLSELYSFHKKLVFRFLFCILIAYCMNMLSTLLILSTSFDPPGNIHFTRLIMGIACLGICIWGLLMTITVLFPKAKQQLDDFNDIESREQPTIWRLEGEEWLRYLNYMHGPDRLWREWAPYLPFCCRKSTYNRLSNRRYGHIVLFSKGFIIDELYLVSFRAFSLTSLEIFAPDEQTHGLRIHTHLQARRNRRSIYFDVFAPSSVSMIQLETIVQSYSAKIPVVEPGGPQTVV